MSRRQITTIALALAAFALSACSNITGPQSNDTASSPPPAPCQITNGSGTC